MRVELTEEQIFVPKTKRPLVGRFCELFRDQAQQVPQKGDILHQLLNKGTWKDKRLDHALSNHGSTAQGFVDKGLLPYNCIGGASHEKDAIQDNTHLAMQQDDQMVCFVPFSQDDRAVLIKLDHLWADLLEQIGWYSVENRQE